jgi:hypothetical protein
MRPFLKEGKVPDQKSIYCEFCHVAIHSSERPAMVNGLPYHRHHTPEKTGKPKLNAVQLAALPSKTRAVM